ncbi:S1 RNA-binding domain-containing protein [Streptomyces sp. NPDC056944]|uniref:S1 RNA-binding domain-containing protein n=1 Tax=Streptomyces sp. NPDC056944 TaxID=3345972 RepID=UPI003629FA55
MDWQSESPELWAFLGTLQHGEILTGSVTAIERFGVFVALDNGPAHPLLPGVGFITIPELSWRHITAPNPISAEAELGRAASCNGVQVFADGRQAAETLLSVALHTPPAR